MAILHPIVPPPVDPKIATDTVPSVASGASTALECLTVSAGKRAKMMGLIVTSSVPFKAELRTVSDGVAGDIKAVWHSGIGGWDFKPPSPQFIVVVGTSNIGTNGFRVTVTNLGFDTADISAVFYYDEE